jgi:regulator of protease activity HflC (stomatin/prohibitin superfamily)
MFLIVLGIFTIIFTAFIAKTAPKAEKVGSIGRNVGIALAVVGGLLGFMVQIDPGEVGVKKLFGKVQSGVLREGLNIINPLLEVERFDIRTQNYTMSSARGEGEKMGDNVLRVLSADGLEVEIDMTILFRLIPESAPVLLQTVGRGYRDVIVRPITRTKVRDFAAYYDAVSLYSVKRDEFQQRLFSAIEKEFKDRGLVLEQVLIRNINLPESVKMAIEAKINAEQESQKMRFVLDKEKQEAERKRVEAQGIADYQRILTASLTDKLLQYEQIKAQKELAGSPNAKIVIMNGKGAPLLVQ